MRRPKSLVWSAVIILLFTAYDRLLGALMLALLVLLIRAARHERRAPLYYDASALRQVIDAHNEEVEVLRDAA